jgi:hypothetical protein
MREFMIEAGDHVVDGVRRRRRLIRKNDPLIVGSRMGAGELETVSAVGRRLAQHARVHRHSRKETHCAEALL